MTTRHGEEIGSRLMSHLLGGEISTPGSNQPQTYHCISPNNISTFDNKIGL